MADFDSMTLAEFEAYAARIEAAAKLVRDARRELLGGVAATQPAQQPSVSAATSPAPSVLTPMEIAQREALLARNREALPDEIKRAEGMS